MSKSFDRLLKNYCNARKSWEVWCFLSGLNTELDQENLAIKKFVDSDSLFYHLRFLSMKDYFIELYKILRQSPNNKDNVFWLIEKRIRSNPRKAEELTQVLQEFKSIDEIIEGALKIRDKLYAHLDSDYEKIIKEKSSVLDSHKLFGLIERAIISLESEERLLIALDKIKSRDDYYSKWSSRIEKMN
jgi:hypothetical protein